MGRFKTDVFVITWSPEDDVAQEQLLPISTSTSSTPPHEVLIAYVKTKAKKWALAYEEADKVHFHMAVQWYKEYESDYTDICKKTPDKKRWWFQWCKEHPDLKPPALDVKAFPDLLGAVGYVGKQGMPTDMKGITEEYVNSAVNEYGYFKKRKTMDKIADQYKVISDAKMDLYRAMIRAETSCSPEDADEELVKHYYTFKGAKDQDHVIISQYKRKRGDTT